MCETKRAVKSEMQFGISENECISTCLPETTVFLAQLSIKSHKMSYRKVQDILCLMNRMEDEKWEADSF